MQARGIVWALRDNHPAQLSDGKTANRSTPVRMSGF